MKKLALITLVAMVSSFGFAQKLQEKDVPSSVKATFQKQYPNTKKVKWEKEEGNFEAEFEFNKIEQSVVYNSLGKLLETEIEIEKSELSKDVVNYININYKGKSIKEVSKIVDENGLISYEVDIKGMDLIFDSNGIFIKEIKDK